MPNTFRLHPDLKLLEHRFWCRITLDEVYTAAEQIWSDPAYDPSYRGLFDIRNISVGFHIRDIRILRRFLASSGRQIRGDLAIVTERSIPTAFAMLYATRTKRQRIRVFSSPDVARQWLFRDL
ncbi:MAG: hypothetical protein AAF730_20170 [Bacteroidota bacterium]